MECFSGIGGMIRVGCRLTSAALRELNSEYRLRTSRSCSSCFSNCLHLPRRKKYPCTNRVYDIAPPTLMAHPSICDHNLQTRVLVEELLYPTIVSALLPWYIPVPRSIFIFLIITQIAGL